MAHRPVRSSRSRTIAKRGRRVPTTAIVALPKRHRLDAPSPIKRRTACRARSRSVRRSRIGPAARPHRHEPLTTARSLWPLRRRPLRRRPPSSPRSRIGRMRKIAPALNHLDRPSKTRSPDATRHAIGRRRRHGPPEQRARVRPARPGVVLTRRARQTSSPDAPPKAPAWPGAPPIAWPVARWRLPVSRAGREWTPGLRRVRSRPPLSVRSRRQSSVRSRRQSSVSRQGSWRVARAQMHRRRPMTNWPALSRAVVSWPRRANLLVPSLLRLRNPVVVRPSAPPAPAAT